jgi:hypothetical protein
MPIPASTVLASCRAQGCIYHARRTGKTQRDMDQSGISGCVLAKLRQNEAVWDEDGHRGAQPKT